MAMEIKRSYSRRLPNGTGGSMKTLSVYSHSRRQIARIRESLYWADAAGPIAPEVKIELEPALGDDDPSLPTVEVRCEFGFSSANDYRF